MARKRAPGRPPAIPLLEYRRLSDKQKNQLRYQRWKEKKLRGAALDAMIDANTRGQIRRILLDVGRSKFGDDWLARICEVLIRKAHKGNLSAGFEIFNRLEGRPAQALDVTAKKDSHEANINILKQLPASVRKQQLSDAREQLDALAFAVGEGVTKNVTLEEDEENKGVPAEGS